VLHTGRTEVREKGYPNQGQHAAARVPPENPSEAARPERRITTEDLGMRTIQGMDVSGKRTTTIVPAGWPRSRFESWGLCLNAVHV
jgi:hypothetical protein